MTQHIMVHQLKSWLAIASVILFPFKITSHIFPKSEIEHFEFLPISAENLVFSFLCTETWQKKKKKWLIMDWKELFGSDSEEEENEERTEIPGLTLVRQALDHTQQMAMTNAIIEKKYFFGEVNQAMCFGELPSYLSWLSQWVIDECPDMFNTDILNREPLFDQAILNLYKKGLFT
ncbi:MAG: hypothetical protein JSY10_09040 [Paenibacillus sp.]|nr:hypothetical protein [Paenibacillus sp.]